MTTYNIKLLPKQLEVLNCKSPELLVTGGFGSAKTRILCLSAVRAATVPGSFVGIFRKYRTSLMLTTVRTLLDPESNLPPVLPPEMISHHDKAKGIISIKGGGQILYVGLDQPLRLRSLNLSTGYIDEGVECNEEEYTTILFRLRNTNSLCRQLVVCTNPGSTNHFLYKRFFENAPNTRTTITMKTEENIFLPPDYIERFRQSLSDIELKRYFYGQWCTNSNAVYPEFTNNNIKEIEPGINENFYIAMDVGYRADPTVLLFCGHDPLSNTIFVYNEHYLQNKLLSDVLAYLEQYRDYNPLIVCDPSAAGYKNEMKAKGFRIVEKVNNRIVDGISITKNLMKNEKIIVDPKNINLIKELDLYSYDEKGNDLPKTGNDHGPDGLRYLSAHLNSTKMFKPKIHFIDNNEDIDE